MRRHIGEGADRLLPTFLPAELTNDKQQEIEKFRARLFTAEYLSMVRPFPCVRQLFERMKTDQCTLVLGSSCTRDEIDKYKRIANIGDLVDAEITSDDADCSKPSPDIFQKALEQIAPEARRQCIVVGDSLYDGEAARKAGLRFVGVLCGGSSRQALQDAGAAAIFNDPADLLQHWPNWLKSAG